MYKFIAALTLAFCFSAVNAQNVKAVYHLTTDIDTAALALNNIKNHLDADPKAKIVVVANGRGIEFLVQDAKDSRGREFSSSVSTLAERGVEFRVCNNTLSEMKIPASKLLMETTVVPSGVAEAARLQFKENFAYIKP